MWITQAMVATVKSGLSMTLLGYLFIQKKSPFLVHSGGILCELTCEKGPKLDIFLKK